MPNEIVLKIIQYHTKIILKDQYILFSKLLMDRIFLLFIVQYIRLNSFTEKIL